jgi:hypothetical protein
VTTPERAPPTTPPDAGGVLPEGDPGAVDHDDSLLDESLRETFPASDPIAPASHRAPASRDPKRG